VNFPCPALDLQLTDDDLMAFMWLNRSL